MNAKQILYLDSTTCNGLEHERMSPATKWWTSEKMKMREKQELSLGGFGLGQLKGAYVEANGKTNTFKGNKNKVTDFIKSLDEGLEELLAYKDNLECNFYQAIDLYPKRKLLNKWKKTYQKSFIFKQKGKCEETKESEKERKQTVDAGEVREDEEEEFVEVQATKDVNDEEVIPSNERIRKDATLEIVLNFDGGKEKEEKEKKEIEDREKETVNMVDEFKSPYNLKPVDPRTKETQIEKKVADWMFSF